MNIIITMAGRGSRFYESGYTMPKYQIEVHGKSLFEWSMESLKHFISFDTKLVFVCLKENDSRTYVLEQCNKLGLPIPDIIELDKITDGQATSAFEAVKLVSQELPLLIYNIDTHINPNMLKPSMIKSGSEGWIPCFKAPGEHWSFVKIGADGWAVDVAEKSKISDFASIGLYWFSKTEYFSEAYNLFYGKDMNLVLGERYIAPLYNYFIKRNMKISITEVPASSVHVLGTPAELKMFEYLNITELYS